MNPVRNRKFYGVTIEKNIGILKQKISNGVNKDIFLLLDKDYVAELFSNKKFVFFPELKDRAIEGVAIEKKSPDWQRETCLVKYKIFFTGGGFRVIWGAAGVNQQKKNAWEVMTHLFNRGFASGRAQIARPLDFNAKINALLYEEAAGESLSSVIQEKNIQRINESLQNAAQWLFKLHSVETDAKTLPDAVFWEADDYLAKFEAAAKILPDLKKKLISACELGFIDQFLREKADLIHNDFYPGNIIVGVRSLYGIDFEKSGRGIKFFDLATLLGWFEFFIEVSASGFSIADVENFKRTFLQKYCDLTGLKYAATQEILKRFLAKIFLDQAYICIMLALGAWNYVGPAIKKGHREKILMMLEKARHYIKAI